MPSPFPGMDPYLEGELWPGFHTELTIEIKRQLLPKLRPRYYPFTEKYQLRALMNEVAIAFEPDVAISRTGKGAMAKSRVGAAAAPIAMTVPLVMKIDKTRIAIKDVAKRKLVTVIEGLSPANKLNPGRKQYLRKREEILESPVHLIEIDLQRKGRRLPMVESYPEAPYFVLLSRSEARPRSDVWPIKLDEALPTIRVPLLAPDPDVELDLQAAFARAYDLSDYGGLIDYKKGPQIRLTRDQARLVTAFRR